MCLATAYKEKEEPGSILLEYVARIDVAGTTLTLTDVMGETRVVEGTIKMVDLASSKVVINCIE